MKGSPCTWVDNCKTKCCYKNICQDTICNDNDVTSILKRADELVEQANGIVADAATYKNTINRSDDATMEQIQAGSRIGAYIVAAAAALDIATNTRYNIGIYGDINVDNKKTVDAITAAIKIGKSVVADQVSRFSIDNRVNDPWLVSYVRPDLPTSTSDRNGSTVPISVGNTVAEMLAYDESGYDPAS